MTLLAPRIGNDVSYVTQISDDIHFAWQAQYLVKCESDFSWQAQRDDDFLVGLSSDVVGLSSNRLSIGGSIQGVTAAIWSFQISWQAHYLVRLQGDFTCSTHWKMTFHM